jgi:hypothetical protein
MKPRQMPQACLSRFLELSDRVETLEQEAFKAEAEVARLRSLLSSRTTDKTIAETKAAQASFDAVYADAQLKRSRATAQSKLLATTKQWIEELPPNTKLVLVHAPIDDGASLAQVRGELAALRSDLSKLRGNLPAGLDIGRRVDEMVAGWARKATPEVRGFAAGQQLDVLWNGNRDECNGLWLLAALQPAELGELIFKAIHNAQPLSAQQHSEKMLQTTQRINELSYIECALVERNGAEHDVSANPWCVLGVRIGETEAGDAAA